MGKDRKRSYSDDSKRQKSKKDRKRSRSRSRDRRNKDKKHRSKHKKDRKKDRKDRNKSKDKYESDSQESQQKNEEKQNNSNYVDDDSSSYSSVNDENEKDKKYIEKKKIKGMRRKKKAQRKYKTKKRNQLYDDHSSDDEQTFEEKVKKSGIWQDTNIPEELKDQFARLENEKNILIVANIPITITTYEIKEYFQTLVTTLNPQLVQSIQEVTIGETKNYAIMKFGQKEALMVINELTNLEYKGFKLKLKKPKGFFQRLYQKSFDRYDPYGNIITSTNDVDHTLYMGGLPQYLQEEEVRKICESFGILRYFNLIKEKLGEEVVSRGYCFFEYQDPKVTEKAVEGLNQLDIGDKKLKVCRASRTENVMPKQTNEQKQQLKKDGKLVAQKKQASNSAGSFLATYGRIADPLIQMLLNIPQTSRTPSKVIQLLNMATPDDLVDDQFYDELLEDVKNECLKLGNVEVIDIPRPDSETGQAGPAVGKVFIRYQYMIPAKKAQYKLNGRIYNKKTVIASFYNEEQFDQKQYLSKG